jgi:hypothetical protein
MIQAPAMVADAGARFGAATEVLRDGNESRSFDEL